jgi:hypothetical protein
MKTTLPPRQESHSGYEGSRFNAVRHAILSVHTVLPWEEKSEYESLLSALVEEHAPHGPTEDHLIEEIAGVIWRKRRLRLAEAASYRRGIKKATNPFSDTLDTALNQVERAPPLGPIIDAVSATPSTTAKDLVDLKRRNASVQLALKILSAGKPGAYEAALAELDEQTRTSWQAQLAPELEQTDEDEDPDEDWEPYTADATGLAEYLEGSVLPACGGAAWVCRTPLCDPYAGPRRGARLRQARADWPIRSSPRSQTRTHARHVATSPRLATIEGVRRIALTRFR